MIQWFKKQNYTTRAAIIAGVFAIFAAIIGLCGTIIAAYIGYLGSKTQIEKPIYATQTAEVLSLATEAVINGTQLPKSDAPGFSLSVEPGPFWLWAGLIKTPIDRTQLTQTIAQDMVSNPEDVYTRFADIRTMPHTIHIILTGHSSKNLTYISNRVPVKILSYQSVPETVDFKSIPIGGGEDVWLFSLNISSASAKMPNQISWASYSPDLQQQLSERITDPFDPLVGNVPTEILKFVSGESPTLPDYFQIKENEMIVFSVACLFKEPGVYTIELGIEYVYNSYKNIAWAEPPLIIYVPKNYYMWSGYLDATNRAYLSEICEYSPNNDHTCKKVCELRVDGLKCK